MRLRLSTFLLAVFSAVSLALLSLELRATGVSQPQYLNGLGEAWPADLQVPFSLRTNKNVLFQCDRALSAPYSLFQPQPSLQAIARSCATFADDVIWWMPTHGFAHLIAAQAAQHKGDNSQRDVFLNKSQEFAPFEGWLAERRFALVANHNPSGKRPLDQVALFDATVLLHTQSGAELLADHYVDRPNTRALITAAAAKASRPQQTRFMNQLRLKQAGK